MSKYNFVNSLGTLFESARERRVIRDYKRGKISDAQYNRMAEQDPSLEKRIISKAYGAAASAAHRANSDFKKKNGGVESTQHRETFERSKDFGGVAKRAKGRTRSEVNQNIRSGLKLARQKRMANDVINTIDV